MTVHTPTRRPARNVRRIPLLQDLIVLVTRKPARQPARRATKKCNSFEIARVAHHARLRRRAGMFWNRVNPLTAGAAYIRKFSFLLAH